MENIADKVSIAFYSIKKRKKIINKLKKIESINLIEIKKISQINDNQIKGLIIDFWDYIENKNKILNIGRNNFFKIFIVITKDEIEDNLDTIYENFPIYSILPMDFPLKKIKMIFDKFVKDYTSFQEKTELIKKFEIQTSNFNILNQIGISLAVIRDIDILFDMILTKVREITDADAGSIFLVEETIVKQEEEKQITEKQLRFVHSQNFSFPIKSPTFTIPLTKTSIVGYSALTGKILNIPDAHKIPQTEDYSYSIDTEKRMKVHNRSMITVPMKNQKDEIIGVIQLFNKKKDFDTKIDDQEVFEEQVIPFTFEDEEIVISLANQAAVSLENNILYKEIKTIFEGFIRASVVAIEARDPTTSGHSERVAKLTKELAICVNNTKTGEYSSVFFTEEDLRNIEYAGLLHDFGKIGVREKVLVKAKKLYPESSEFLKMRYNYLKKAIQYDFASKKLSIIKERGLDYFNEIEPKINLDLNQKLGELNNFLETILQANEPTILEENSGKIISELIGKKYLTSDGEQIEYLKEEEKKALMILRGSLTEEERLEIESHVTHTFKFLCRIPWTKEMANIPYIAYKHHEKLDGHGYPRGIKAETIPIQARMMTIADIYDALTASDRPYKKAVPVEKALSILEMEMNSNKIDKELLRIFIDEKVYKIVEK
ncbi:MAG: hypothetical protein A2Y34_05105 [Spirochaetes bacterium GWC1_27_15]|nr:MAG: hypothetical protein A2Z98_00045 [Spirochaetes bacterium GWB1_27_13]OHD20184.1 MAG: hypothetical protein A2Y34_05105 [Spirochaetes bacterium GWC1_27_15]